MNAAIEAGAMGYVTKQSDERDWTLVRGVQENLLEVYAQDFSKHASGMLSTRLKQVWTSLPAQLSKENKKFMYGQLKKGARAKDFDLAIQWLSDCALIHLVHSVSKPGYPPEGLRRTGLIQNLYE